MNIRNKKIAGLGRWIAIAIGVCTAVHVGHRLQTEGLTEPGSRVTAAATTAASATAKAVPEQGAKR